MPEIMSDLDHGCQQVEAEPLSQAATYPRPPPGSDASLRLNDPQLSRCPAAFGYGAPASRRWLEFHAALDAGDRGAADPDRAVAACGDADPATAAKRRALAHHIRGGGAAGAQQPLGERGVQAAGHRVLAGTAQLRGERAHLERLG